MKLNDRPNSRVWYDYKICYMHVNKAATNTLNHALRHVLGPEDRAIPQRDIPLDWLVFAFVREPWDRLISAYTHNIVQDKITGPLEARGYHKDMTLETYIQKIINTPNEKCDKHFVPQFHRLSNTEGQLIPNWIGKIETFLEDWVNLCERFSEIRGFEIIHSLRWIKRSSHYRNRIPPEDLESEELKALVRKRYLKDYKTWYKGE